MAGTIFYKADDGNMVDFFNEDVKNETESEKAGRPIYKTIHKVRVHGPGNQRSVPEFNMDMTKYPEWASAYKKWLAAADDATGYEGTPLAQWPAMTSARAAEFRDQKVFTVEMIRDIPDSANHRFGPDITTWKLKAKAFLEAAAQNAPVERLTMENNRLTEQVALLQQQMADIIAKLGQPEKRGPGRPPKDREAEAA